MVGISQRYDDAFSLGTGYDVAPGLTAFAEYSSGESHQDDINLNTGVNFSSADNNAHGQAVIGTRVQWQTPPLSHRALLRTIMDAAFTE